jgi:hypothetical protein
MPRASAGTLLRHLRELVASGRDARTDRELLENFRARRDDALTHRAGCGKPLESAPLPR